MNRNKDETCTLRPEKEASRLPVPPPLYREAGVLGRTPAAAH